MTNTYIQSVQNERGGPVDFLNLENGGCNRDGIPSAAPRAVGCVVPWATTQADFAGHHMEIRDADTELTLFYIWQRNASDGNFVRFSTTGFVDPGDRIPGHAESGGANRVIRVDGNGIMLQDL